MTTQQRAWRVAGLSERGPVRAEQQDLVWCYQGALLVCDGLGGQNAGALASQMVGQLFPPHILQAQRRGLRGEALAEQLAAQLAELSRQMFAQTQGRAGLQGMGSTAVCAALEEDQVVLVWAGDSTAWRLSGSSLEPLTREHNLAALLSRSREISSDEYQAHPGRHVLASYIGMEQPQIEHRVIPWLPGERLLLCTDGLSGVAPRAELAATLGAARTPEGACARLIEVALEAQSRDNITAAVAWQEE